MKMADRVTNSSATLRSSPGYGKADLRYAAWFSLAVLAGSVVTLYPVIGIGCLAVAAALGVCWLVFVSVRRVGLEFWQTLALAVLSGYLVLNYGFDNLAFHIGGFPILISYGLMYASLALAVVANRHLLVKVLNEPALLCVIALLVLALFHMVTDIPSYGAWAFRDCTMCFDGLFLVMGLLWAMKSDNIFLLAKWLMVIFVLNMAYSFTLPWADALWSWSPVSGAFIEVPILGNFSGSGDILLAGAVFCICVGSYVISRPRWLIFFLAVAQVLGVAITQVRRMYLGIVVVIVILFLVGEIKKFSKLFILVPSVIILLLLATSIGGLEISGRVGPVNLAFFKDHIRSMFGREVEDTPGSSVQSRFDMGEAAMKHFRAHPVFGEGFGRPLLDEVNDANSAVTRMPHNSNLTYLARLGAVGLILWVAFHFCLLKRFLFAFRQRHSCDKRLYAFVLWFFLFYVLFMIVSFAEGPFEFPCRAIPFYFLMGFALGLIRWRLSPQETKVNADSTPFATSVQKAYL
jgi:O-antigen ligase